MLQRASSVGIYKQVEPQLLCGQHWELWVPVYCPLFSTRAGFPPTGRELNTASAMDSKTRLADKNYSNYFLHVPGLCIACRPILLPIVETQTGIAMCCVAQQMRRFPQPSSIHKSRKPPQPMGAPSAVAAHTHPDCLVSMQWHGVPWAASPAPQADVRMSGGSNCPSTI